jgi:signal transduction histidine kinase
MVTSKELQTRYLSRIQDNVGNVIALISDLTDISRMESGNLQLQIEPVSMPDIVNEIVKSQESLILAKNQKLVVDIASDLPKVQGDPARLKQVLTNLVSNAYKYTPPTGQIDIRVDATPGNGDKPVSGRIIHVVVKDTGIGISEDEQVHIFEKFFRASDAQAREAPGTGLGLHITKQLIEMQHGRIWFESKFRGGTTFHITLPAA